MLLVSIIATTKKDQAAKTTTVEFRMNLSLSSLLSSSQPHQKEKKKKRECLIPCSQQV